jgi:hypothetical protein
MIRWTAFIASALCAQVVEEQGTKAAVGVHRQAVQYAEAAEALALSQTGKDVPAAGKEKLTTSWDVGRWVSGCHMSRSGITGASRHGKADSNTGHSCPQRATPATQERPQEKAAKEQQVAADKLRLMSGQAEIPPMERQKTDRHHLKPCQEVPQASLLALMGTAGGVVTESEVRAGESENSKKYRPGETKAAQNELQHVALEPKGETEAAHRSEEVCKLDRILKPALCSWLRMMWDWSSESPEKELKVP